MIRGKHLTTKQQRIKRYKLSNAEAKAIRQRDKKFARAAAEINDKSK